MTGYQKIFNDIKQYGRFVLNLGNNNVELLEEDLVFEKDKLWFLTPQQKLKGVLIVRWNGKDINELLYN